MRIIIVTKHNQQILEEFEEKKTFCKYLVTVILI